jgi:hypothetical protein
VEQSQVLHGKEETAPQSQQENSSDHYTRCNPISRGIAEGGTNNKYSRRSPNGLGGTLLKEGTRGITTTSSTSTTHTSSAPPRADKVNTTPFDHHTNEWYWQYKGRLGYLAGEQDTYRPFKRYIQAHNPHNRFKEWGPLEEDTTQYDSASDSDNSWQWTPPPTPEPEFNPDEWQPLTPNSLSRKSRYDISKWVTHGMELRFKYSSSSTSISDSDASNWATIATSDISEMVLPTPPERSEYYQVWDAISKSFTWENRVIIERHQINSITNIPTHGIKRLFQEEEEGQEGKRCKTEEYTEMAGKEESKTGDVSRISS